MARRALRRSVNKGSSRSISARSNPSISPKWYWRAPPFRCLAASRISRMLTAEMRLVAKIRRAASRISRRAGSGLRGTLATVVAVTTLEDRPNTALLVVDVQTGVVEGAHERDAVVA